MKISFNWLKKHIDLNESPEEISDLLTNCGLEVEDVYEHEFVKGGLKGLIVGHVVSAQKHPDADKLKLTKVDVGNNQILEIVCGAPNVEEGQKVVVAIVGVTIYPSNAEPFTIKKAKIRGVESNGMICAEDEIGLGSNHSGIMILDEKCIVGKNITEYIKTGNDYIFEIGLTANRGDAASHHGVARDLKALLNRKLNKTQNEILKSGNKKYHFNIFINNKDLCQRYCGVLINNVRINVSPEWLKNKLDAIGIKPINNVVDITNYVMHDIGQPIHAFDYDKIKGNIEVRKSVQNEKIITLANEEKKLTGNELVIADSTGPIALAGVIGGLSTCIDNNTKNIFVESACFDMSVVRKTSKMTGISTDSSFRFERGIDPDNTFNALIEASNLIIENAGGNIVFEPIDILNGSFKNSEVYISFEKLKRILGIKIEKDTLKNILLNLDMQIIEETEKGLNLSVPRYRIDVSRDIDVFEEILRIYGFSKIEIPETINTAIINSPKPDKHLIKQNICNYLTAQGFNEIMTNSLTNENYYTDEQKPKLVRLNNPLSNELAVMRYSMLPTMLESVAYNKNRKINDIKFFEFGKIYSQNEIGEFKEFEKIVIMVSGNCEAPNWKQKPEKADYYYLKTILNNAIAQAGTNITKGHTISKIENTLLKKTDIKGDVWYAEINFDKLISDISKSEFKLQQIPVFPEVSRDLSLIFDKSVKYSEMENIFKKIAGKYLQKINLTDIYSGKPLEPNQKSYTFNIILYDKEKTMNDIQIDIIMQKLISTFENELGAIIRK